MRNPWLGLLFLSAMGACTSSGSSTGIELVTCATDSTLTYENYGAAFISTNCLSCHRSNESPTLATQAAVQANVENILDTTVYTDYMPDGRSLTNAQREELGAWLACGAP